MNYKYFKKYYRLVAVDLSKQGNLDKDVRQRINFVGKLEEEATMFFIIEKKEETILEFSQNFANVLYK